MDAVATASPSQLDEFASRAGALYSLPAVAVEVLALTENPSVDVRALKECIERDPALTVKLLRVVNSSLFGLSREVSDLNQALALLGVKPLKMLVLGFSLPEKLLAAAGRDELAWYWRHTLTRAVAAREISEQVVHKPGDEAFLTGLLQDIGALVLLGELGVPYANFLKEIIAREDCLHHVQLEELGFDHTELSAKLLDSWNMPAPLVAAIAEPRTIRRLAMLAEPHAGTSRVLHVAELVSQIVADRRFSALSDLLEAGRLYFGMDRAAVDQLIASLEDKITQLADVLSVHLANAEQYPALLAEAHRRMSAVAEAALVEGDLGLPDETPCEAAGGEAQSVDAEAPAPLQSAPELHDAIDHFLAQIETKDAAAALANADAESEATALAEAPTPALAPVIVAGQRLKTRLTLAVGSCRAERQSLSLLAVALEAEPALSPEDQLAADQALRRAWQRQEHEASLVPTDDPTVNLVLLSGSDRHDAVRLADELARVVQNLLDGLHKAGRLPKCRVAVGVASVHTPAKNFPPLALLETALRCLNASQRSGGGVKSLEIS